MAKRILDGLGQPIGGNGTTKPQAMTQQELHDHMGGIAQFLMQHFGCKFAVVLLDHYGIVREILDAFMAMGVCYSHVNMQMNNGERRWALIYDEGTGHKFVVQTIHRWKPPQSENPPGDS